MSVRVDLHVEALEELEETAAWYETRRPGLGLEFMAEIERVVATIAERPQSFQRWVVDDPARRALTRRFPFALFIDLEADRALVVAIAHTQQASRLLVAARLTHHAQPSAVCSAGNRPSTPRSATL